MKNIIIILAILFITVACKAQQIVPLGTSYESIENRNFYIKDIDNHHDAIVGVWKWEDGDNSFEITLQEFEMFNYPPSLQQFRDEIFGKYTYIENGVQIAFVSEINVTPDAVLYVNYLSPTSYDVIMVDVSTGAYKVGEFVLLDDNTATLSLRASEGIKIDYVGSENFSLPTDITLIKQ